MELDLSDTETIHLRMLTLPHLSNVTILVLQNCNLSQRLITESIIENWTRIQKLDLSKNSFGIIPRYFSLLGSLQWLDMSNNSISHISQNLDNFSKLSYLNLSNNSLRQLPDFIGESCTFLEYLDLSSNQLYEIDRQISKLPSIKILKLSGNCIRPSLIDFNATLESLSINLDFWVEFPYSIFTQSLKKLEISNALLDFHLSFSHLQNITHLSIVNSNIALLFSGMKSCKKLVYLNLTGNILSSLPIWIVGLDNIKELNLSYNSFQVIPNVLFQMESLEKLDLTGNWISEIPGAVSQLKNLKHFNLERNKLTSITSEIGNLAQLEILNVGINPITTLPESLSNIHTLKTIIVDWSRLEHPCYSLMSTSFKLYSSSSKSCEEAQHRCTKLALQYLKYAKKNQKIQLTVFNIIGFGEKNNLVSRVLDELNHTLADPVKCFQQCSSSNNDNSISGSHSSPSFSGGYHSFGKHQPLLTPISKVILQQLPGKFQQYVSFLPTQRLLFRSTHLASSTDHVFRFEPTLNRGSAMLFIFSAQDLLTFGPKIIFNQLISQIPSTLLTETTKKSGHLPLGLGRINVPLFLVGAVEGTDIPQILSCSKLFDNLAKGLSKMVSKHCSCSFSPLYSLNFMVSHIHFIQIHNSKDFFCPIQQKSVKSSPILITKHVRLGAKVLAHLATTTPMMTLPVQFLKNLLPFPASEMLTWTNISENKINFDRSQIKEGSNLKQKMNFPQLTLSRTISFSGNDSNDSIIEHSDTIAHWRSFSSESLFSEMTPTSSTSSISSILHPMSTSFDSTGSVESSPGFDSTKLRLLSSSSSKKTLDSLESYQNVSTDNIHPPLSDSIIQKDTILCSNCPENVLHSLWCLYSSFNLCSFPSDVFQFLYNLFSNSSYCIYKFFALISKIGQVFQYSLSNMIKILSPMDKNMEKKVSNGVLGHFETYRICRYMYECIEDQFQDISSNLMILLQLFVFEMFGKIGIPVGKHQWFFPHLVTTSFDSILLEQSQITSKFLLSSSSQFQFQSEFLNQNEHQAFLQLSVPSHLKLSPPSKKSSFSQESNSSISEMNGNKSTSTTYQNRPLICFKLFIEYGFQTFKTCLVKALFRIFISKVFSGAPAQSTKFLSEFDFMSHFSSGICFIQGTSFQSFDRIHVKIHFQPFEKQIHFTLELLSSNRQQILTSCCQLILMGIRAALTHIAPYFFSSKIFTQPQFDLFNLSRISYSHCNPVSLESDKSRPSFTPKFFLTDSKYASFHKFCIPKISFCCVNNFKTQLGSFGSNFCKQPICVPVPSLSTAFSAHLLLTDRSKCPSIINRTLAQFNLEKRAPWPQYFNFSQGFESFITHHCIIQASQLSKSYFFKNTFSKHLAPKIKNDIEYKVYIPERWNYVNSYLPKRSILVLITTENGPLPCKMCLNERKITFEKDTQSVLPHSFSFQFPKSSLVIDHIQANQCHLTIHLDIKRSMYSLPEKTRNERFQEVFGSLMEYFLDRWMLPVDFIVESEFGFGCLKHFILNNKSLFKKFLFQPLSTSQTLLNSILVIPNNNEIECLDCQGKIYKDISDDSNPTVREGHGSSFSSLPANSMLPIDSCWLQGFDFSIMKVFNRPSQYSSANAIPCFHYSCLRWPSGAPQLQMVFPRVLNHSNIENILSSENCLFASELFPKLQIVNLGNTSLAKINSNNNSTPNYATKRDSSIISISNPKIYSVIFFPETDQNSAHLSFGESFPIPFQIQSGIVEHTFKTYDDGISSSSQFDSLFFSWLIINYLPAMRILRKNRGSIQQV